MKWKSIIIGMVLSVSFMAPNIVESVLAAAKSAVTVDVDAGGYASNEVNATDIIDVSSWKEKAYYGSESWEDIHFVVSVENTGKVTGNLSVRVDVLAPGSSTLISYWCYYNDDPSTYQFVQLKEDTPSVLAKLEGGHTIYLFDMIVAPEDFLFDGPIIFTAFLFDVDDDHLMGIDTKTVFLGTNFKTWSELP
ncbi:MAG: hypothetical protein JRI40_10010 [Deltaproteobacteria bacterium]|nr:hypothetical protein [Deltaproteobacteria bacterium]